MECQNTTAWNFFELMYEPAVKTFEFFGSLLHLESVRRIFMNQISICKFNARPCETMAPGPAKFFCKSHSPPLQFDMGDISSLLAQT
jgi:hypothetical protein